MPGTPMTFINCSLNEAILYFNDYYKRAKGTKEINRYNEELYFFLNLNNNINSLKNLSRVRYFAIVKRRDKGGHYYMELYDSFKENSQAIYDEDAISIKRFITYLEKEETQKQMRQNDKKILIMPLILSFKENSQAIYDEDAISIKRFITYLEKEETQKQMRQNDKKILIMPLILSVFFGGVIIWSGTNNIFMLLIAVVFILVSIYSIKEFLTK